MRKFSLKRQQQDKRLETVVAKIRIERGNKCEVCESKSRPDASHNYSRKDFPSLIDEPENITLLCRRHHQAFENNMLFEFKTDELFRHMKDQYKAEPDIFRAKSMRQHLNGKLLHAKENAEKWGATFPAWAEVLLLETQF